MKNYPGDEVAKVAFDAQTRLGYYAIGHVREGAITFSSWIVINSFGVKVERGGNTGTYFIAADPFTALKEAYEWHEANVENVTQ